MLEEKTPLIPRFNGTAEPAPRRQRYPSRKTALKVLGGAAAAAGILYYSIPEGMRVILLSLVQC